MANASLANYTNESRTVFYRSRFTVSPNRRGDIEIWPQIIRTIQNWLEDKEDIRDQHGQANLFSQLSDDVTKISELCETTQAECYASLAFAMGEFEAECEQSFLATKALIDKGLYPEYWAMEYIEKDSSEWYRKWITNIGISADSSNSYIVNVRVSISDDPSFLFETPRIPPRNTPRFIADMLDIPDCITRAGNIVLSSEPKIITAATIDAFINSLTSDNRTIPLIVVSAIRNLPGQYPIDVKSFARKIRGSAVVYRIDNSDYQTRNAYHRVFEPDTPAFDYRINSGCMRVFFPGVDLNDPEGARRHHYFTQDKLDKTDERQISNDICGALTRMYQRKQDEALDPRSVDALINRLKRNELVQRFHELEAQRKEERIEPVNLAGLHTEAELKKAIKQKEDEYQEKLASSESFYNEYIAELENDIKQLSSDSDATELQSQIESLIDEQQRLKSTIAANQHAVAELESRATRAEDEAVTAKQQSDLLRATRQFPKTPCEALEFAKQAFPNRLFIHEEAIKSAQGFTSKATDEVFDIMRCLAVSLWPKYFEDKDSATKAGLEFQNETGYEVTFHESSTTNKDNRLMRERQLSYDGRAIDISPHIKGHSGNRNAPLRVHFCVDRETQLIVVGHCGAHKETAGTKYQR